MTYIYLNIYSNGYMYVGSHTWNGVGIDPSYQGSSKVAKHFNWSPSKIILLAEVSDKLKTESEFIIKYCSDYGIASCAKLLAHKSNNHWVDKFKDGIMLNCHANTMEQASLARTKEKNQEIAYTNLVNRESQLKSQESRYNNSRIFYLSNGLVGHADYISSQTNIPLSTVKSSATSFLRKLSYKYSNGLEIIKIRDYQNKQFIEYCRSDDHIKSISKCVKDENNIIYTAYDIQSVFNTTRRVAYSLLSKVYLLGKFTKFNHTFFPYKHINVHEYRQSEAQKQRSITCSKNALKRQSGSRKCMLNDGFIGNHSELIAHTNFPHTIVSSAMSEAFKLGHKIVKDFIFIPYTGQNYSPDLFNFTNQNFSVIGKKVKLSDGFVGDNHQLSEHLSISLNKSNYLIKQAFVKGSHTCRNHIIIYPL